VENTASAENSSLAASRAAFIRSQIPPGGLFAGLDWRISPEPFRISENLAKEIESLGRVLLQFYRAANLLYRKSVEGKQPEWVARWLDLGKPADLIALQRSPAFRNDVPRVIRPDILLTENGFSITELDSVPGGIGLTTWLNRTYSAMGRDGVSPSPSSETSPEKSGTATRRPSQEIIGGTEGMIRGFESIFGDAKQVHIVVSEEAATYRPEMEWVADQMKNSQFAIRNSQFNRILIDAPCSNSGVMRRRLDLRWRIQPEEIERVHVVVRGMLEMASIRLDLAFQFFAHDSVPERAPSRFGKLQSQGVERNAFTQEVRIRRKVSG